MFTITINGTDYPVKFGMGFVREMNKKTVVPVEGLPGVTKNVGCSYAIAQIMDGSIETLLDVIKIANKTETPKLNAKDLDEWIEDESTDIDKVFDDVLDFLGRANSTKRDVQAIKASLNAEPM